MGIDTETGQEDADFKAPDTEADKREGEGQSQSDLLASMAEIRSKLTTWFHTNRSRTHLDSADSKLAGFSYESGQTSDDSESNPQPPVNTEDHFDVMKSGLAGELNANRWSPEEMEEVLADYVNRSEKLRHAIRKENIKSYLALRKARDAATTPEQQQELKVLFDRQNEIRTLMSSPDYRNHLDAFKKYLQESMEYSQEQIRSLPPEASQPPEVLLKFVDRGATESSMQDFFTNLYDRIKLKKLQDSIAVYQEQLKFLEAEDMPKSKAA